MKRLILGVMAVLAIVLSPMAPAGAHTATGGANCENVWTHPTNYDSHKANLWSLTLDGNEQHGTFGESTFQSIPVPQDGATHTWAYDVQAYNGQYHFADSGTVGPCGTPATCESSPSPGLCPAPEPTVEHGQSTDQPNCTAGTVTTHHWTITTTPVWNDESKSYVPGEPVRTEDPDTTVPTTAEQCPPPPTCENTPSLCPPPPTCATDPSLCPPPPTCETDASLCPPPSTCETDATLCPPPPVDHVKHAWFNTVRYCNMVTVEGRHNVASIERIRHGSRYVFIGHAVKGAEFANGKSHIRKVKHIKTSGCGNVSGY